ncbi:MAG: T9SS type A sorting domain-containing protein [Rhodothermales bacterium]
MKNVSIYLLFLILIPVMQRSFAQDYDAKILASIPTTAFSHAIAASGDVIMASSPFDYDNSYVGAVYVYRFDGTSWIEEAILTASDGGPNQYFGWSIDLDENVAVVSAIGGFDEQGNKSGTAYIFRYNGSTWVEESKLLPHYNGVDFAFGNAVSLDGNVAIVGSSSDKPPAVGQTGAAYIYRYDGSDWIEEAYFYPDHGQTGILYGQSVAVDGDVAFVGSHSEYSPLSFAGAVYVYRYDGLVWFEESKLIASDAASNDQFGFSISIHNEVAAIGAYTKDEVNEDAGAVYVFRYNGTSWQEEEKLFDSSGNKDDRYGYSLAIESDMLFVGSNLNDDGATNAGSVFAYQYNGTNWAFEDQIIASDAEVHDEFGSSVAVSGDVLAVGAPGEDTFSSIGGVQYTGALYLYDVNDIGENQLPIGHVEFDHVTRTFTGWVCDPDHPGETTYAHIYANARAGHGGDFVASTKADLPGDQAIADECSGFSDHRFSYTLGVDDLKTIGAGERLLFVQGKDPIIGPHPVLANSPFLYEFDNQLPKGYVEFDPLTNLFTGWVCDRDHPGITTYAHIYANARAGQGGDFIVSTKADLQGDQSIADECGGFANHRFSYMLTPDKIDLIGLGEVSLFVQGKDPVIGPHPVLPLSPFIFVGGGSSNNSVALYQNYPNPFNPSTEISFNLTASASVELVVYNMLGQEIVTLVNDDLTAGKYTFSFDGNNLPSGFYVYQLSTPNEFRTGKMLLLK